MKILFVEDKINRRRSALLNGEEDVERLKNYPFVDIREDLDEMIENKEYELFEKYNVLMIHTSYLTETFQISKILEVKIACQKYSCNLVLFSGGADHKYKFDAKSNHQHLEVKTVFFYSENLFTFLDNCYDWNGENSSPSLLQIRYGTKWELSTLFKLKYNLMRLIAEGKSSEDSLMEFNADILSLSINTTLNSEVNLLEEIESRINSIMA
jgi:hypothetical protein